MEFYLRIMLNQNGDFYLLFDYKIKAYHLVNW